MMMLLFNGVLKAEPLHEGLVSVIGVDRDVDEFTRYFEVDCEDGLIAFHNLYTFYI